MHPDWARTLRDQCQAAGVAYFFKQWGGWLPMDQGHGDCRDHKLGQSLSVFDDPRGDYHARAYKLGKKAAGRLLDGREHNDYPQVRA